MEIVVSTKLKIHAAARDRFTEWARTQGKSFPDLKAALESSHGRPAGAVQIGNRRWLWTHKNTFVSYVIKDQPVFGMGGTVVLPFLVDRCIIVTDVFSL
jgi:hypothetical protein